MIRTHRSIVALPAIELRDGALILRAGLMNDEISKVSKACWVDETGRVEVQSA